MSEVDHVCEECSYLPADERIAWHEREEALAEAAERQSAYPYTQDELDAWEDDVRRADLSDEEE